MKPKDFFDAVVRMREKQREYFKTKTSSALTESKRLERAIEQISRLGAECLMEQVIERSLEYELKKISLEDYKICSEPAERDPYPPYRERLHPRKHWQRKPYWLRTRSNPKKKGYH